jgi:actin-related protein 8
MLTMRLILQCVWVPRVLDWETKLQPQPLLWSSRKAVEQLVDIGGDAITAAMKQSVAHLEQPRVRPAETIESTHGDTLGIPGTASSLSAVPSPDIKPIAGEVRPASPMNGQQASTATGKAEQQANAEEEEEDAGPVIDYEGESSKLPLDIAVIESLTQCGSDDRLKRIITNILLVGGVANMQGAGFALQSR